MRELLDEKLFQEIHHHTWDYHPYHFENVKSLKATEKRHTILDWNVG